MKHNEQCWKNQSIRDLGVGGPLASCTCGLDALLRVARAAMVYAKSTHAEFTAEQEALGAALKEVEDLLDG